MPHKRYTLIALPVALWMTLAHPEEAMTEPDTETVVLVHGMGRSRASMWLLGHRLRAAGYMTLNFPYASATASMEELSDSLRAFVSEKVKTRRYHFVGHSLGNIIIRHGFGNGYRDGLDRIVMIAPPNQPQPLAQALEDNRIYALWTGESGSKLASEDFYASLPVPTAPFGVIAGDKGQEITFDEPNDGIVPVSTTRLKGMADWVLVHHTHTFLMNAKDTTGHVLHFLKHGTFETEEKEGEQQD